MWPLKVNFICPNCAENCQQPPVILNSAGRVTGKKSKLSGPHSMVNTLLLRLGKIVLSLDASKLCQMVSSGSLRADLHGRYSLYRSRAHCNLLKYPRAHGSYIADNLVTEDF